MGMLFHLDYRHIPSEFNTTDYFDSKEDFLNQYKCPFKALDEALPLNPDPYIYEEWSTPYVDYAPQIRRNIEYWEEDRKRYWAKKDRIVEIYQTLGRDHLKGLFNKYLLRERFWVHRKRVLKITRMKRAQRRKMLQVSTPTVDQIPLK